jgi:hypothetical protein
MSVMSARLSTSSTCITLAYWVRASPLITMACDGFTALSCSRRVWSCSIVTGEASRNTSPASVTVMAFKRGLASWPPIFALGTSTLMPCTEAVVKMMKMTSST